MYRTREDEAYRGDMDRLGGASSTDAHWTDRALNRTFRRAEPHGRDAKVQPSPYPFTRILSSPPAAAAASSTSEHDDTSDGSDDRSTGSSGRGDAAQRDEGKKHQRWANPILVHTRGPEDDGDQGDPGRGQRPEHRQEEEGDEKDEKMFKMAAASVAAAAAGRNVQPQQSAPSIAPRERTLPPRIDVSSRCCRLCCVVLHHRNARLGYAAHAKLTISLHTPCTYTLVPPAPPTASQPFTLHRCLP